MSTSQILLYSDNVMVDSNHPHIHRHQYDPSVDFHVEEFCCHSCDTAIMVLYVHRTEVYQKTLQTFVNIHQHCCCPRAFQCVEAFQLNGRITQIDLRGLK